MCDTLVAVSTDGRDGPTWFAKNSDREPGEPQVVEQLPASYFSAPTRLQCTFVDVPQANRTNEIIICRPFWMWGAEMGSNEYGVAIGNEAVFTRIPVEKTGLTGMDLVRLALERTASAREALHLVTDFIARYGQGGFCGYRHKRFRYHNSFIIADPAEAWVLETAGPHWAAQRVRSRRTISNALSIGTDYDLISTEAIRFARSQGWCRSASDFSFARCFGNPAVERLSGGAERAACTLNSVTSKDGPLGVADMIAALTNHGGLRPAAGWRMRAPCAHASWWPARRSGQTTGSLISRLDATESLHWVTGTSSPCLSVFKPVAFGSEPLSVGRLPGAVFDPATLFWSHERLHRLVVVDYERRRKLFEKERSDFQSRMLETEDRVPRSAGEAWDNHLRLTGEWSDRVLRMASARFAVSLHARYWGRQNLMDGIAKRSGRFGILSARGQNTKPQQPPA